MKYITVDGGMTLVLPHGVIAFKAEPVYGRITFVTPYGGTFTKYFPGSEEAKLKQVEDFVKKHFPTETKQKDLSAFEQLVQVVRKVDKKAATLLKKQAETTSCKRLVSAFDWETSLQGYDYWNNIASKLPAEFQ